jgi:hypothetical protein
MAPERPRNTDLKNFKFTEGQASNLKPHDSNGSPNDSSQQDHRLFWYRALHLGTELNDCFPCSTVSSLLCHVYTTQGVSASGGTLADVRKEFLGEVHALTPPPVMSATSTVSGLQGT